MKTLIAASLALIGLQVLAGCAREADMVPLNDAANAAGIPKLDVALYGMARLR